MAATPLSVGLSTLQHTQRMRPLIKTNLPRDMADNIQNTYCFTIAVVGCRQTGKTTFIKKSFKKLHISDDSNLVKACNTAGRSFSYTTRLAQVTFADGAAETRGVPAQISVLEVALEDLDIVGNRTWPEYMPPVDAIFLIYDCTDVQSYTRIAEVLGQLTDQNILVLMLACKSDLPSVVDIDAASQHCRKYEVGLVETESSSKAGKHKMRVLVDWTMKTLRRRYSCSTSPLSPDTFSFGAPWLPRRHIASSGSESESSRVRDVRKAEQVSAEELTPTADKPPSIPTDLERKHTVPTLSRAPDLTGRDRSNSSFSVVGSSRATARMCCQLDALLHRVFHVAITGDEPSFVECFFLTYRHFTTPRNVLLGFQKYLFQVSRGNQPGTRRPSNVTRRSLPAWFGDYPKTRIFSLLDWWRRTYPGDFASPGACSAFVAIVVAHSLSGSVLGYAPELIKFGDEIPSLSDPDQEWAVSDVLAHLSVEEDDSSELTLTGSPSTDELASRRSIVEGIVESKASLKKLRDVAAKLSLYSSKDIAQEITRLLLEQFLAVASRDWVSYGTSKKRSDDHKSKPLSRFSSIYNQIGFWVTSLVLCHDTPKGRAKQCLKFIEVAQELRQHHNYAGLRAMTAGMSNATYEGDKTLEAIQENSVKQSKVLQSYQRLFASTGSHWPYRVAFRSRQEGAIIPELEVHTSDIARLHEIPVDDLDTGEKSIHWGKYSTIGRLALEMVDCQKRCVRSDQLRFPENAELKGLVMDTVVMDLEMQYSRMPQADEPSPSVRKWTNILWQKE